MNAPGPVSSPRAAADPSGPSSSPFRSGLVTIVGRPNVGKSTLLNRLVGRKLAIVSEKPQTTRNRITGVVDRPGSQIVLLDTPGLHRPRNRLGEYMVEVALSALKEVEAVLFVVEAPEPPGPGDRYVAGRLAKVDTPVILVANKADLVPGDVTRANLELYRELGEFAAFLAISALTDPSFELLFRTIEDVLPEGPRYYPEGMTTDQPEAFVVAELVREQILALTRDEVPHSVAVVVEEMRAGEASERPAERPDGAGGDGLLYVRATVYVERDSQKGIIVGAKAAMLREIGRRARQEIEALFGNKVYLDLWVKVEPNWRDRAGALRALGYTAPRE